MAGAWNSEYFDSKPERAAPPPVQPQQEPVVGQLPGMYNVPGAAGGGINKVVAFVIIFLRLMTFVCTLIALAVLAADKASYDFLFLSQEYVVDVKFTVFMAYTFLLSAATIVCFYSLCQMIHSCGTLCLSKYTHRNVILAWATFVCDQVLAYFLMAAAAAGAAAAIISRNGNQSLFGEFSCSDLNITSFCSKAEASVGMAFAAFLFLAITAAFSARRLFKLF